MAWAQAVVAWAQTVEAWAQAVLAMARAAAEEKYCVCTGWPSHLLGIGSVTMEKLPLASTLRLIWKQ